MTLEFEARIVRLLDFPMPAAVASEESVHLTAWHMSDQSYAQRALRLAKCEAKAVRLAILISGGTCPLVKKSALWMR